MLPFCRFLSFYRHRILVGGLVEVAALPQTFFGFHKVLHFKVLIHLVPQFYLTDFFPLLYQFYLLKSNFLELQNVLTFKFALKPCVVLLGSSRIQ